MFSAAHLAAFSLPATTLTPSARNWRTGPTCSPRARQIRSPNRKSCPISSPTSFANYSAIPARQTAAPRYTISREKHVQVEGEFADAVLGHFGRDRIRFIVALEGKGPNDPLDRPFAGRRMSAVDQGYRYAINLPCDWIIVTSIRQTRLYGKAYRPANLRAFRH